MDLPSLIKVHSDNANIIAGALMSDISISIFSIESLKKKKKKENKKPLQCESIHGQAFKAEK